MKIGYPCINRSLNCTSSKTFRLASFSEERLIATTKENLDNLKTMLDYNVEHNLLFFRIGSGIVPFASHPVMTFDWKNFFAPDLRGIGVFIQTNNLRVSFHPDQFVLINSPTDELFERSVAELDYQVSVLDLMGLDSTHKVQIHVGGVYGDKEGSIARFIERYKLLPEHIRARLIIENDDRLFSLQDCLRIHASTGVPIIFDVFHHSILNNQESIPDAFSLFVPSWKPKDGVPIVDYSSQQEGGRLGKHCESIDREDFKRFLASVSAFDFDVMLEIKDKERSANIAYDTAFV